MNIRFFNISILLFLFISVSMGRLSAQTTDTLSFSELLSIALQNNYGIMISKNDYEVSRLNNTLGNAGFLPVAGASVSDNYSVTDNKMTYFDGSENVNNGLRNNTLNALVQVNWTLFDGTKMFVTKSRLAEIEKQGNLTLQLQTESVYLKLASSYYALVQEQKLEEVLKYTMGISRFRLELAEKKFKLGAASEIDKIQASLDFSNDSSLLLQQEVRIANLKADINKLASRLPDVQFSVDTEIGTDSLLAYAELEKTLIEQNKSVLIAKNNVRIKEFELNESKSNFLPIVSLYADYEYYNSHNSAGTYKNNNIIGPSVGLRLSYNIFNGFNDNRKRQISKIGYETSQIAAESELNSIRTDLYQNYNDYVSGLKQIKLESENLANARKNLQFAVELYKLGSISEIDFREIQRKEFDAEGRLLSAQYYAKIAEIQLLQISGKLEF